MIKLRIKVKDDVLKIYYDGNILFISHLSDVELVNEYAICSGANSTAVLLILGKKAYLRILLALEDMLTVPKYFDDIFDGGDIDFDCNVRILQIQRYKFT